MMRPAVKNFVTEPKGKAVSAVTGFFVRTDSTPTVCSVRAPSR